MSAFRCFLFVESAPWPSSHCDCPCTCPVCCGVVVLVLKVRDDINPSLLPLDDRETMLFLITLTAGINSWEKCDSVSPDNDCYYSFSSEKLMST